MFIGVAYPRQWRLEQCQVTVPRSRPGQAIRGQLQFRWVPNEDITLLFAPLLITQRSVVQIHPPQAKIIDYRKHFKKHWFAINRGRPRAAFFPGRKPGKLCERLPLASPFAVVVAHFQL